MRTATELTPGYYQVVPTGLQFGSDHWHAGLLTIGLGNLGKSGIRVGTTVEDFQFHRTGLNIPNTRTPNAISHPASATPRKERKKKGLTIRRNSHASVNEIPNKADSRWDCGSHGPQTLSVRIAEIKVNATAISKMMKNQRHTLVAIEMGVLMLLALVVTGVAERLKLQARSAIPHPLQADG